MRQAELGRLVFLFRACGGKLLSGLKSWRRAWAPSPARHGTSPSKCRTRGGAHTRRAGSALPGTRYRDTACENRGYRCEMRDSESPSAWRIPIAHHGSRITSAPLHVTRQTSHVTGLPSHPKDGRLIQRDGRLGIPCCSSKHDFNFSRFTGIRACAPRGAARRYCTGHETDCRSSCPARNGQ